MKYQSKLAKFESKILKAFLKKVYYATIEIRHKIDRME